jgi:autotransporter-associated beta strand protein
LSARDGSVLRVPVGVTLDATGDVQWSDFTSAASNLRIEGTLLRSAGSGDLVIQGPSTFDGTVDIDAGRLVLGDEHQVSGTIDMAADTALEIAGDVTMTAGSLLTGAGALTCRSGTSSIAGAYTLAGTLSIGACTLAASTDPLTLGSYSQSAGRFDLTGDATVSGSMTWTGGTIGGGGRLTAASGMTIAGGIKNLRDATTLVAEADSTWSAGRLWVWDGSAVQFPDGATLDVTGDVFWEGFSSPESLTIDGTLRRSAGDGDLVLDGDSTFNGAIEVHTGRLVLDATHTVNGSLDVAAGAELALDGDVTMTETSQLTGDGGLTCIFETSSIAGSYALGGPVVIEGGTLTISSDPVALASYSQSGGNFNLTGDATVTGSMIWTGGDIGGGGTLTATSGLSLSGTDDKFLYDGVSVVAASTSTWSAGDLVGSQASIFRVAAGATLDVTGDVQWRQFLQPLSNFDVDGTLLRSAGNGDFGFTGPVTNDGTISVLTGRINSTSTYVQSASGTLSLAITGTGAADGGRFVGDDVTLAGTFEADVGGAYVPQLGDLITAMSYSSRAGTFSSYTGFDLGGGLQFQESFDVDSMDLEVISP